MTDSEKNLRHLAGGLEKVPCKLLIEKLETDVTSITDEVLEAACLHSIAVSLRRLADRVNSFYENGVTVCGT